jgi:uncharacterized protein with FMN-binding domain
MAGLTRRLAPGVALAGTALALVFGFDRALKPASAATAPGTPQGTSEGTTADTSCSAATEYTGDSVSTEWGPVQVVATVAPDGTICESSAVVYPDDHGRSVQINNYALPIIEDEVTSAGVQFDAVSGATVTSEGYRASLQSILDSL